MITSIKFFIFLETLNLAKVPLESIYCDHDRSIEAEGSLEARRLKPQQKRQ
ncbi:MAG: hypothetical protein Q7J38_02320 [Gallionella sp.]|nr:hypothetical protein [Gallionella sp.]